MSKTIVVILCLLAWYAAVGLAVWLCYRSGEWFVAGVVALLGAGMPRAKL